MTCGHGRRERQVEGISCRLIWKKTFELEYEDARYQKYEFTLNSFYN
jgi:hypothetical protein